MGVELLLISVELGQIGLQLDRLVGHLLGLGPPDPPRLSFGLAKFVRWKNASGEEALWLFFALLPRKRVPTIEAAVFFFYYL